MLGSTISHRYFTAKAGVDPINVVVGKPGSIDHRHWKQWELDAVKRKYSDVHTELAWFLFVNQKPESLGPFPTSVPGTLLSSLVAVFCSLGAV